MLWETIKKSAEVGVGPNLLDYDDAYGSFTWKAAREELSGLPAAAGLNIAYEAVDRHVKGPIADITAIRWISKRGEIRDFSYADLQAETNRFANVLRSIGISAGDRVFSCAGRIPELYMAVLGTLKNRSVFCPLFSAFGPEPIKQRMVIGSAKAIVTTERLYRRKIAPLRGELPELEHVLLVGDTDAPTKIPGTHDLRTLMRNASMNFEIPPTDPEDMALLHFTSGTTGRPKGAVHVHAAAVAHHITGKLALDLRRGDIFWCTADPGWVTGTSYGIISPLTNGVTLIVDEEEFDAERWYRTIEEQKVSVWYTAPTAIRMMMRIGAETARKFDTSSLRFLASVGEPLNPEAVVWGAEAFGLPFHDNWWQTETGGIMVSNYRSMDIKPGSMGRPLPGVEAAVVRRNEDGSVAPVADADAEGELALRRGWPSMFRGYLGEEERYQKCFAGDWYLTGDLAKQDEDGYFWFVGRADDVIKSAGHLIGPFEVESALMEHPAVAEAGVIGIPDETMGEIVKAFVALKPGHEPSDDLRYCSCSTEPQRLGPVVAPRQIGFRENLPKTRSGKIMRRLLKARELGLPEGDISTLESDER